MMAFEAFDKAFDNLWNGFDKLWEKFNREFDKELPETTVVKTTIRVSLTKKQVMGLLTGEHKRLLFKVKDDVAIQVEVKP